MQVRLSNFNAAYLQEYGHYDLDDTCKELTVGTTVCMTNNSTVLGTVVELGKRGPYYDYSSSGRKDHIVKEVNVRWHGGAKRGTTENNRKTADLVNYTAYKACILKHVEKMNEAEIKAGLAAPK